MGSHVKLVPIHMGPHLLGLEGKKETQKSLEQISTET